MKQGGAFQLFHCITAPERCCDLNVPGRSSNIVMMSLAVARGGSKMIILLPVTGRFFEKMQNDNFITPSLRGTQESLHCSALCNQMLRLSSVHI